MSKINYIQITSLTMEDTNALVEEIARIQKVNIIDIKKLILEMKDSEAFLKVYKCNLMDLVKVINFYDYPVKLRIEYLDESPKNSEDSKKKYTPPDETSSDIKLLQEQLSEIQDEDIKPERIVIGKADVEEPIVKVDINPNDLPDFHG
jgi:hypothetical protein